MTCRASQPWEEATIRDLELFKKFGQSIRDFMEQNWKITPLAATAWDAAIRHRTVSDRLCDCFTALRATVERSWGQQNLELPMSRVCETDAFRWFFAHLMVRLPELHSIYNSTVANYRRTYRLRSRTQPVPNLDSVDDWYEAPFWVWRRGDSHRGRLFCRRVADICELRDESEVFLRLPVTNSGSLQGAVDLLAGLAEQGIRLRTRALTTTLYSRLCLADLFLHGIGGAKYDEMTDRLCEGLFGIKSPQFMTVSATLHLPLGGAFDTTESQLREIQHRIRDVRYNPDRHLEHSVGLSSLIAEKNELIEAARQRRQDKDVRGKLSAAQHRRLSEIRKILLSSIGSVLARYEADRDRIQARLSANALIRNREFSFVLYPEALLREFLLPAPSRSGNTAVD